jgi:ubiquinone biosynthesis protein
MKQHPLYRTLEIIVILLRHGLGRSLMALCLLKPIPWSKRADQGPKYRQALEALGPLFIKVGQILSTRFDLLPPAILKELAALQDSVPPFSGILARQIVEQSLQAPLHSVFNHFDTEALASASIAQVHAATLISGEAVVLKILRPHIAQQIKRDVRLLKLFAAFLDRFYKKSRRFKLMALVHECEKTLYHEMDLIREGANASQLKRSFQGSHLVYIPTIYWSYSTEHVLVMERVYGIPLLAFDRLEQKGFDRAVLAKHLVELFFTQVFRDCFFHADMHPGNVLITEETPPRYILMDFGIMGSLSPEDQRYLANNLLAFVARDYRRVAILHVDSGWVPSTTRIDDLEGSIRAICEPLLERPRSELSLGALLKPLFKLAIEYQINIQPQLLLFQKTLAAIEILSLELDPRIDLWKTAEPFLEKWLKDQMGFKALIRSLKEQYPAWVQLLPQLPTLLARLLKTSPLS